MFPFMMTVSLLGVIIDISRSSDYNEYIQKINADNLELETLKRILPKEKLNKLNRDKSKYRLPTKYLFNQLYQVDDQQQLNNLSEYIKTYRRLGRNFDILYESYKNNTLKEYLQEYNFNLSKEEYEILVNYIKEKGPSTISRKKIGCIVGIIYINLQKNKYKNDKSNTKEEIINYFKDRNAISLDTGIKVKELPKEILNNPNLLFMVKDKILKLEKGKYFLNK